MKEETKEQEGRKTLTFFLIFFPSVLIAIIPSGIPATFSYLSFNSWWPIALKLLLLLYQFVLLKNFIDTHYN